MNFDYEVENEEGEIVATLSVSACFSAFTPSSRRGHPDNWCPAEGGELEELCIYNGTTDITNDVDKLYGDGTYDAIQDTAIDRFDPKQEADNSYDGPDPSDFEPNDYWN